MKKDENDLKHDEIDNILNDFNNKKNSDSSDEELAPPELYDNESSQDDGEDNKNKEKKSKNKKVADHRKTSEKTKAFFKSKTFKIIIIAVAVAVLIFAIVFSVKAVKQNKIEKLENKYGVSIDESMNKDFIEDYAQNTDFAGKLSIKDSEIDYNVFKSNEQDFYTNHGETKAPDENGCVYIDSRVSLNPQSQNTVVYASKKYFGDLEKMYSTSENYKKYPIINFNTIYENAKYKVVGAFYTNTDKSADSGKVFPYNATNLTESSMMEFRSLLNSRFIYSTERDIKITDNLLMLSVDSDLFKSAKFVVTAVKIADGESERIDTSNIIINKNPHYPQAYYDLQKIENPFELSTQWYPEIKDGDSDYTMTNEDILKYIR